MWVFALTNRKKTNYAHKKTLSKWTNRFSKSLWTLYKGRTAQENEKEEEEKGVQESMDHKNYKIKEKNLYAFSVLCVCKCILWLNEMNDLMVNIKWIGKKNYVCNKQCHLAVIFSISLANVYGICIYLNMVSWIY